MTESNKEITSYRQPTSPNQPPDITYFDNMRINSAETNHLEVFQEHTKEVYKSERTFNLRHLTAFFHFIPIGSYIRVTFEALASGFLAVHHFNNGIADIVPQISNTNTKCPDLKFTIGMIDTQLSPSVAIKELSDIISKGNKRKKYDDSKDEIPSSSPYPTALIGATRSQVMSPVAKLAGIFEIPQILCSSTSSIFDNKDEYPLTGRIVPPDSGEAEAAMSYLSDVLGVTHLFVIFLRDDFGLSYMNTLNNAGIKHGVKILTASIPFHLNEKDVVNAVDQFQKSGYRYCFGVLGMHKMRQVLIESHQRGLSGPGYFWMLSDKYNFHPPPSGFKLQSEKDSSLIEALSGAAFVSSKKYSSPSLKIDLKEKKRLDAFFQSLNQTFLTKPSGQEYFRSKIAEHMRYAYSDKFFEDYQLPDFSPVLALQVYESVIAMTLAACDAESKVGVGFDGSDLFASFVETKFDSIYGRVAFNPRTGTRSSESVEYSLINIVPEPKKDTTTTGNDDDNNKNNKNKYTTFHFDRVTHIYKEWDINSKKTSTISSGSVGQQEKQWRKVEESTEFIYSDGSTVPPYFLPPLSLNEEKHLINGIVLVLGLIFCCIILSLSLWFGCWTAYQHKSRVIKASQPIFLAMLCIGTFLMGLSIIPMSLQQPTLSQKSLDVACMSTVWLLSIGFVVSFSALISKMIRINKIFNAKSHNRVIVKPQDVLGPFILLFSANVIVLVLWTFLSPLKYHHKMIKSSVDRYGRPYEYFGTCYSTDPSDSDFSFLCLLIGINFVSLIFANYQAYLGRHIEIQYSESHSIALSMALMLQLSLVGIPALISSYKSPSALFFVSSSLVTMICVAIILPIFIPKRIFLAEWRKEVTEKEERRSERLRRTQEFQNQVFLASSDRSPTINSVNIERRVECQDDDGPNLEMEDDDGPNLEMEDYGLRILNLEQGS